MGGASSYISILCIAAFLSITWLATKISKSFGVSSIVLEIAMGVIMGPSVVGLMPAQYAQCGQRTHAQCDPALPGNWTLRQRLAQGMPIGDDLRRISFMDYCNLADYTHHHAGSGHGDAAGELTGDGHTTAVPGTAEPTTAAPITAAPTTDGAHAGDEHTTVAPASGTTASGSGGHADQDGPVDPSQGHDDDNGRRLASGGGDYATYDECLVKSCEADIAHECQLTPDIFTLIGHAGVAMMIFESGMHFDFEKAAVVGPKACCVAVLGTILPLISGTLLTMAYGKPMLPDAVSVGTALAPTSVGIALRLLGEAGVLQEDFGQAIITAAFVDDILSLVLFNVLFSLQGDFEVVPVVVYPVVGVILMGFAMFLAVKFWPWFITDKLLPRIGDGSEDTKISRSDEVLFLVMMVILIGYATITHFLGTHLWGCFLAGMSFACLNPPHHAHHVWVRQTKRITGWMIRIFFSCTVAFSIPVGKLLSIDAFWKGSIMGIGPCVLSKVLCAPFMGEAKFVIGWAMVGRAEFAYLIAQMASAAKMIDEETFSICIWALLYATIFAPFIFRVMLTRYVREMGYDRDEEEQEIGYDDVHIDISESKDYKLEYSDGKVGDIRSYGKPLEIDTSFPDTSFPQTDMLPDKDRESYSEERCTKKASKGALGDKKLSAAHRKPQAKYKPWFGRAPADTKNVPDRTQGKGGFFCCLFFKKIVV